MCIYFLKACIIICLKIIVYLISSGYNLYTPTLLYSFFGWRLHLIIYFEIFYIVNKNIKNGRSTNRWVTRTHPSFEEAKNDRSIHTTTNTTSCDFHSRITNSTSLLKLQKLLRFVKSVVILQASHTVWCWKRVNLGITSPIGNYANWRPEYVHLVIYLGKR